MSAVDTVIDACKNVVLDLIIPVDSGTPFQRAVLLTVVTT